MINNQIRKLQNDPIINILKNNEKENYKKKNFKFLKEKELNLNNIKKYIINKHKEETNYKEQFIFEEEDNSEELFKFENNFLHLIIMKTDNLEMVNFLIKT